MAHQAATSPSEAVSSPRPASASGGRAPRRAPHLWRARPWHQQLPLAHRAPERGRLHRRRRLLAHRPAGRGAGRERAAQRRLDGPRGRRAGDLRRQVAPPQRHAGALGRDRGVPPRAQRRRLRRPRPPRDRGGARNHPAQGGSAAGRARLPQIARARRRPGADLRHWRRLDRARAGRPRRRRHAADHRLVVGAVGRGLADRDRGPRGARGPRPRRRLQAHARARPAQLPPLRRHAAQGCA